MSVLVVNGGFAMNKYLLFTFLTGLTGIGILALYNPFGGNQNSPFKPSKIDSALFAQKQEIHG